MSPQIIVLEEAEDEPIAAERWYESRQPNFGRGFRLAIYGALKRQSPGASSTFKYTESVGGSAGDRYSIPVFDHLH